MSLWSDLIQLFFPRLCVSCRKKLVGSEAFLCLECLHALPRTNYVNKPDNPLEVLFAGRLPFERVASYAYFSKEGMMQKIVHELKYESRPELGEFLGQLMARELESSSFFNSIDCIVPVPLHPKRLKQRGYNQSFHLSKGIADHFQIPLDAIHLIRKVNNASQTKLSRVQRWENVDGIFSVIEKTAFDGRHVLLVDDILTTGSTIESCAKSILDCQDSKISILTLGSTI